MFALSVAVIASRSFPSVRPPLFESKVADEAPRECWEKVSDGSPVFFVLSIDDILISIKNIRVLVCKEDDRVAK